MALLDLTYDVDKYIVQRLKTNENLIYFQRLPAGMHCGFSDDGWDYWVYDTYEEMAMAWPDYGSEEWPTENKYPIPDREDWA